jgi:molecular chaperone DnaJ
LRGEGDHGRKGGPAGDLYLLINVKKHSIFKRNGFDVFLEVPISFVEAALGAEIDVPTLHGKVKLKIPEGTQTATNFSIRGREYSASAAGEWVTKS